MQGVIFRVFSLERDAYAADVENKRSRPLPEIIAMKKTDGDRIPASLTPYFKSQLMAVRQAIDESSFDIIAIGDLAKSIRTNEHKLKTGFKALFGMTIYKYHKGAKMDQAHRMLESGEKSVKEVAYQSGYSNIANFTNAFKSWYGYPPSALKVRNTL